MKNNIFAVGIIAAGLASVCIPTFASAATLTRQLEAGMNGSDVSSVQTFLAQDSTLYP